MNKILILAILLASSTSARPTPTRSVAAPAAVAPAAERAAEGISRPLAVAQVIDQQPIKKKTKEKQEALGEAEVLDNKATQGEKKEAETALENYALIDRERINDMNSPQWGDLGPVKQAEWDAEWDAEGVAYRQYRNNEIQRDKKLANKVKETKYGSELEKTSPKSDLDRAEKLTIDQQNYPYRHSDLGGGWNRKQKAELGVFLLRDQQENNGELGRDKDSAEKEFGKNNKASLEKDKDSAEKEFDKNLNSDSPQKALGSTLK